jgi:hypothetical protein
MEDMRSVVCVCGCQHFPSTITHGSCTIETPTAAQACTFSPDVPSLIGDGGRLINIPRTVRSVYPQLVYTGSMGKEVEVTPAFMHDTKDS